MTDAMKAEIEDRFARNLDRVRGLVAFHAGLVPSGAGDPADLLRAAVVFLHAALEDLVRSIARERLPIASAELLSGISLPDLRRGEKFSLVELAKYRGRTVDEVVRRSAEAHLEASSYSHVGEIIAALRQCRVDPRPVLDRVNDLSSMISRRHWMVHQADRADPRDRSGTHVQPVALDDVTRWIDAVEAAGRAILDALS